MSTFRGYLALLLIPLKTSYLVGFFSRHSEMERNTACMLHVNHMHVTCLHTNHMHITCMSHVSTCMPHVNHMSPTCRPDGPGGRPPCLLPREKHQLQRPQVTGSLLQTHPSIPIGQIQPADRQRRKNPRNQQDLYSPQRNGLPDASDPYRSPGADPPRGGASHAHLRAHDTYGRPQGELLRLWRVQVRPDV